MLDVTQLSRAYGNFKAVDNVSFTINKGEIVGLLGHNGAGKTTIMKMLSGYLEPNAGTVKINQLNIQNFAKEIQRTLGYLPENLPIYPEMTVAEYLNYAAELKGLANNRFLEIKKAIKATELEDKLLSQISSLSRGYKQRVGVAQAILGNPELLILDEPTNGLDPTQTEHMRQLIKEIAKKATVILSTHIMQEVDAICDRVLIIKNGQLAVNEKICNLRKSNNLTLSTSMLPEVAEKALSSIPEISSIQLKSKEKINNKTLYQYDIERIAEANGYSLSAIVSKKIIQLGEELYQLNETHRDLETLFKEVNQSTLSVEPAGAKNAA